MPFCVYFVNDQGIRMLALKIGCFFLIQWHKEPAWCSIAALFNSWYMEGHLVVHRVMWGITAFFIILF